MASCSISQPVYLPWVGYFNLIARSDKFVFLDDAQFSKNAFDNRNRLPTTQGFCWLTIPILKGHLSKTFNECQFDEVQGWRKKHLKTIKTLYSRSESFSSVYGILEENIADEKLDNLSALSISIIRGLCAYLDLPDNFYRSSELGVSGKRSEKILEICKRLDCAEYISAIGAKEYIDEDSVLPSSEIKIVYQNIQTMPYSQITSPEFQSHMSIIDLLFNMKKDEALKYILSADPASRALCGLGDKIEPK